MKTAASENQARGERARSAAGLPDVLACLQQAQMRPEPFAPSEHRLSAQASPGFWDDPYIAAQLLASQIDAHADGASRRLEVVDQEVAWLVAALDLAPGAAVLDLGCGPGLYASRLAARGFSVTGVDLACPTIAYAEAQAAALAADQGLAITYRCQDYLTLDDTRAFDAVLLVNGDFSSHSPEDRGRLLENIARALKPGGRLALDVLTRAHQARYGIRNQWYVTQDSVWRAGLHMVLEESFSYPQQALTVNQYVIVEPGGAVALYRNWFQAFTPETITDELEAHGFRVEHLGGTMRGGGYTDASEWISLLARNASAP